MSVTPNGLEYFLLGNWKPCTKIKYTELSARIALSRIVEKSKHKRKYNKKRRERCTYYCSECLAWHLTKIK